MIPISISIYRLILKPEYAFGEKGHETFKIPPNATVEYTVTLNEFEREPEAWKLNAEESLTQAKLVKDKATGFLKQEKYELAIKLYEKANTYLSNITSKCTRHTPHLHAQLNPLQYIFTPLNVL